MAKAGRPAQHNWDLIREEYVTGSDQTSFSQLSEKYGAKRVTIARHSGKEDWQAQRAQFRHQVAMKTRAKTSAHEAKLRAEQILTARHLRNVGAEGLMKLRQPTKRKMMVKGPDGKEVEVEVEGPSRLDSEMDMSQVRQCFKDAATIENQALGMDTEVRIRLDSEVSEILRRIRSVLAPTEYDRVIDVLAAEVEPVERLALPASSGQAEN